MRPIHLLLALIQQPSKPMKHDLIKTGDPDAFPQILDRNGEVALDYCRRCHKGEGELQEECIPPSIQ